MSLKRDISRLERQTSEKPVQDRSYDSRNNNQRNSYTSSNQVVDRSEVNRLEGQVNRLETQVRDLKAELNQKERVIRDL